MHPPLNEPTPARCQNCDQPLRPSARFCPACGHPVPQDASTAPEATSASRPRQPGVPRSVAEQTLMPPPIAVPPYRPAVNQALPPTPASWQPDRSADDTIPDAPVPASAPPRPFTADETLPPPSPAYPPPRPFTADETIPPPSPAYRPQPAGELAQNLPSPRPGFPEPGAVFTPASEAPLPVEASLPPTRATGRLSKGWKIAIAGGCGCLILLIIGLAILGYLFYQSNPTSAVFGIFYSPTPTHDYPATFAAATAIAGTLYANQTNTARIVTQTAQASATYAAQTANAAALTHAAATVISAQQTRNAEIAAQKTATQLAFEATRQAQQEMEQAVEQICAGRGVSGAAHYVNARAFHPILISPELYPYPSEARPSGLSLLELVACVENSYVTTRSVPYQSTSTGAGGYTCLEQVNLLEISVRSADQAREVRTYELRGPKPASPCGYFETFPANTFTIYKKGKAVDVAEVWEKVKELVYLELRSASFTFQP